MHGQCQEDTDAVINRYSVSVRYIEIMLNVKCVMHVSYRLKLTGRGERGCFINVYITIRDIKFSYFHD